MAKVKKQHKDQEAKASKADGTKLFREMNAHIRAADDGSNERKFVLSFSSEEPYERWFGSEILSHDDGAVDLTRLNDIGVVLFNHDRDYVLGKILRAWIEDGRGCAEVEFDDDEEAEKIRKKVAGKTLQSTSVGYCVDTYEEVKAGDLNSQVAEIRRRLGSLERKTPNVLQNALNATARKVRKQIVKDAKGEYELSDKKLLNATNAMKVTNARRSDLRALLVSEGPMNDLMKFMVSPTSLARGELAPESYAAHVLRGGFKALDGDPKPFVTQFRSGHIAIVVRDPSRRMRSNPKKAYIKKLLSPAVPHMLQNEDIMVQTQMLVDKLLPIEIDKQIEKILAKG